jgi:hypothetical protein
MYYDNEYVYYYDLETDTYCYPNSRVLINKFNIRDRVALTTAERPRKSHIPFNEGVVMGRSSYKLPHSQKHTNRIIGNAAKGIFFYFVHRLPPLFLFEYRLSLKQNGNHFKFF